MRYNFLRCFALEISNTMRFRIILLITLYLLCSCGKATNTPEEEFAKYMHEAGIQKNDTPTEKINKLLQLASKYERKGIATNDSAAYFLRAANLESVNRQRLEFPANEGNFLLSPNLAHPKEMAEARRKYEEGMDSAAKEFIGAKCVYEATVEVAVKAYGEEDRQVIKILKLWADHCKRIRSSAYYKGVDLGQYIRILQASIDMKESIAKFGVGKPDVIKPTLRCSKLIWGHASSEYPSLLGRNKSEYNNSYDEFKQKREKGYSLFQKAAKYLEHADPAKLPVPDKRSELQIRAIAHHYWELAETIYKEIPSKRTVDELKIDLSRDGILELLSMTMDLYRKTITVYEDKLFNGVRKKEWEREYMNLITDISRAVNLAKELDSSEKIVNDTIMKAAMERYEEFNKSGVKPAIRGIDSGPPKFDEEEIKEFFSLWERFWNLPYKKRNEIEYFLESWTDYTRDKRGFELNYKEKLFYYYARDSFEGRDFSDFLDMLKRKEVMLKYTNSDKEKSTSKKQVQTKKNTDKKVIRGWLGVEIKDISPELADAFNVSTSEGVLISKVQESSPAQKAGMKSDDIVVAYNGKSIRDVKYLKNVVAQTKVNETVEVKILRNGKQKTLPVKIEGQPAK